jgi:hypothetical protein
MVVGTIRAPRYEDPQPHAEMREVVTPYYEDPTEPLYVEAEEDRSRPRTGVGSSHDTNGQPIAADAFSGRCGELGAGS